MAVRFLDILRALPLCLLAAFLREMIVLDWLFPAEQRTLESQCGYLGTLPPSARADLLRGFNAIELPLDVIRQDWLNHPQRFLEVMSAQLWASHQMDAFHQAAESYAATIRQGAPDPLPAASRLVIVVLDSQLLKPDHTLFRKLRPKGVYFSRVNSSNGYMEIVDTMQARSRLYPSDCAHWWIDGSERPEPAGRQLNTLTWTQSGPLREAVLQKMQATMRSGVGGPEMLRSQLAEWSSSFPSDTVNERFARNVYAEGSGTQIFSTVFAQWAAREVMRRAQPVSLTVRFGARQAQQPMDVMLATNSEKKEIDAAGSLVDADMGAYYTWINLTRLSGADQSRFLVWSEGYNQAVAIGPGLPRATQSSQSMELEQLLKLVSEA